jgi:hypothetical protein
METSASSPEPEQEGVAQPEPEINNLVPGCDRGAGDESCGESDDDESETWITADEGDPHGTLSGDAQIQIGGKGKFFKVVLEIFDERLTARKAKDQKELTTVDLRGCQVCRPKKGRKGRRADQFCRLDAVHADGRGVCKFVLTFANISGLIKWTKALAASSALKIELHRLVAERGGFHISSLRSKDMQNMICQKIWAGYLATISPEEKPLVEIEMAEGITTRATTAQMAAYHHRLNEAVNLAKETFLCNLPSEQQLDGDELYLLLSTFMRPGNIAPSGNDTGPALMSFSCNALNTL